jgi:hypothetical protein
MFVPRFLQDPEKPPTQFFQAEFLVIDGNNHGEETEGGRGHRINVFLLKIPACFKVKDSLSDKKLTGKGQRPRSWRIFFPTFAGFERI